MFAQGDVELIDAIGAIRCPTLIATGELDPNSTPAMAHSMAARISGARAVIWPGLPHLAPVEGAAAVNELLVQFLVTECAS